FYNRSGQSRCHRRCGDLRPLALDSRMTSKPGSGNPISRSRTRTRPGPALLRPASPLASHVDGFIQYLAAERRLAANTLQAYRNDLLSFLNFLAGQPATAPETVEAGQIRDYLLHCRQSGISSRSNARRISALRAF